MKPMKSHNQKKQPFPNMLTIFLLIFGLIAFSTILTNVNASDKELRIGVTISSKMEAGPAMFNGATIAAEELNSKGGILGRQIKLFSADDENRPEKGIMALKNLVEMKKVHLLTGAATSGVLMAQMDYLKQYNILFINAGASSPLIAKRVEENYEKYKYVFRMCFNSLFLAKNIGEDQVRFFMGLGFKKFAILAEDATWNRGLVGFLEKKIPEQGGTVTTTVNFATSTIDFAPVFSKISSSGAEVVIGLVAITDGIALSKQYHEMQPPFRMAGFSHPGAFGEYWGRTGGKCIYEVNAFNAMIGSPITPKTMGFYNKYKKRFGMTPHGVAGWAYDGIYVVEDAARRANSLKTEDLIKAIEETDYVGVMGRVVFNKKTHDSKYGPDFQPFLISQWHEGGKLKVLWPDRFFNAKYANPPWLR